MKPTPLNPQQLRALAETQLATISDVEAVVESADKLLHQLQVHQVELELQNEELRRTQIALEQVESAATNLIRRNQILMQSTPVGIHILDAQGKLIEANVAFCQHLGYSAEEILQLSVFDWEAKLSVEETRETISKLLDGHTLLETVHRRKDGSLVDVEINVSGVELDGQKCLFALSRDISQRKQIEAELRIAAIAFESQQGMMISDAHGSILRVNHAFSSVTGYSAEEAVGKNPRILQSGRHDVEFYATMWDSIHRTGTWQGEIWNRRKHGEIYPEYLTITAVKDVNNVVTNYVAAFHDITRNKAAEEEIERLAFYDPLTGLPNRRLLQNRLKQALAASHRSGQNGGLLFIDMDNFKNLNDTLGHDTGDILLQQVAQRLSSCVREGDTVARLGGDEFVVMLENLNQQDTVAAMQIEVIGHKILFILNENYQLADHDYHSTPSIGATVFNSFSKNTDELLKQADIAMYQAKTAGRNTLRFFDPQMQACINARVEMEADLLKALTEDQFKLYYQLQSGHNHQPLGAEVLIRWQHPQRGLVSPLEFIPLAEECGLILAIGQWVLETACAQIKEWEGNFQTQHLLLAVNVSARQFHQADFVEQVRQILNRYDIKPDRLKLELTESLVLDNITETIEKMNVLREIGVHFSMDDFGTGYSSLSYLTQLPLDQLKIDQSFVRNIGVKSSDAVIVQTIIGMAHNLGMEVIAEGVETEAQRTFLEQHGCLLCQGYLFSKPVPLEQFEVLITQACPPLELFSSNGAS